jgi:hypothetical protein
MRTLPALLTALCLACPCAGSAAGAPGGDDTAALQARIDTLAPGATLALEPRPYCFQGLRITRSLTIEGQGAGRTVCTRAAATPFFQIQGRDCEVTIRQLALNGAGLDAAGIVAKAARTLRLEDLRVERCGEPPPGSLAGDRFGKPVDGVYARDVDRAEVYRCSFLGNARDGFIGIPVRHLVFAGNTSSGNGRMGCTSDADPEGQCGGPLEAAYLDNDVSDCGTGGLHVESDEKLPVVEARFEGNRIRDCGNRDWGYSWGLVAGTNVRGLIRGNRISGVGVKSSLQGYRSGIIAGRLGGALMIEGNTVQDCGLYGILINASEAPVRLKDNVVRGSGASGISVYQIPELTVEGCTVEGSGQAGLRCRLCPSALVRGNRFRNNSREALGRHPAVRAEACTGIRMERNDLGGPPQGMGVEVDPPGCRIQLDGNTFEGQRRHPGLCNVKTEN